MNGSLKDFGKYRKKKNCSVVGFPKITPFGKVVTFTPLRTSGNTPTEKKR